MARLPVRQIERLIYPVSFYRHKARYVRATCQLLLSRFGGRVPRTMEELLLLPGVGRKTANLVLILAHQSVTNICVDTHVHRISNRLGWVATRTPERIGAGVVQGDQPTMVAVHQPVSGHLGTECVSARVSTLRCLCDFGRLSARGCRSRVENERPRAGRVVRPFRNQDCMQGAA